MPTVKPLLIRLATGNQRVPGGIVLFMRKFKPSGADVARWLRVSRSVAYKKLRGEVGWSYDDVWHFAEGSGCPIKHLVD